MMEHFLKILAEAEEMWQQQPAVPARLTHHQSRFHHDDDHDDKMCFSPARQAQTQRDCPAELQVRRLSFKPGLNLEALDLMMVNIDLPGETSPVKTQMAHVPL